MSFQYIGSSHGFACLYCTNFTDEGDVFQAVYNFARRRLAARDDYDVAVWVPPGEVLLFRQFLRPTRMPILFGNLKAALKEQLYKPRAPDQCEFLTLQVKKEENQEVWVESDWQQFGDEMYRRKPGGDWTIRRPGEINWPELDFRQASWGNIDHPLWPGRFSR